MHDPEVTTGGLASRRRLFSLAGLAAAGALLPGRVLAGTGDGVPAAAAPGRVPTSEVGRKFHPDGRVRGFRGNTIVCHVPQQGEHAACFNALLDIYRELPAQVFAPNVTALPPSSYHMTLFDGANETAGHPGLWPSGLPLDSGIDECSREVERRLEGFALDCELPLRMRIDATELAPLGAAVTLPLLPVDEAENAKLRRLRDRLSAATGIRSPRHDSYRFHISLAYVLWELSPAQQEALRRALRQWSRAVATASPMVILDAPELCTYKDMFAFNRVRYLS